MNPEPRTPNVNQTSDDGPGPDRKYGETAIFALCQKSGKRSENKFFKETPQKGKFIWGKGTFLLATLLGYC